MNLKQILKQTFEDVRTKLTDEFDKNFERKAFFDKRWSQTKLPNRRGSLMMRSGKLRRSIKSRVQGDSIVFRSNMPYAALHNEGGEIKVTSQMKKYFWAMYYKSSSGGKRMTQRAKQFKAMALKKVGSTITIEQRQFIGKHPEVEKAIEKIVSRNFSEALKQIRINK